MHEESDSTLIARAKEEPEAFGLLYERYVDKVYNYIYYRTGHRQNAEDLAARTFYQALKHFPRYEDRGAPFSAWLYRIAHNLVANWHRDHSRRQLISLDQLATLKSPSGRDPDTTTEKLDEEAVLLRAIRRLPPDRQQLIILKHVERMSNVEIGEIMGRTEGAIKSLYHRTLTSLREDLSSEWEELE
jgi:RNA polymerase sigma-70 factor, ECF subfamily